MRHQAWMNDKIDEQRMIETQVTYGRPLPPFPLLSWYAISIGLAAILLWQ